ncbi:serine/arginine repetitive matrix protein 2-like isoform X3 [Sycon ciliatum]|uniref:serine/arginine repetitive matrix protein 2-like isoform X3 n=1 Tax=Sycon ciliatum TaxID=27933 RepID=UPI0031F6F3CD
MYSDSSVHSTTSAHGDVFQAPQRRVKHSSNGALNFTKQAKLTRSLQEIFCEDRGDSSLFQQQLAVSIAQEAVTKTKSLSSCRHLPCNSTSGPTTAAAQVRGSASLDRRAHYRGHHLKLGSASENEIPAAVNCDVGPVERRVFGMPTSSTPPNVKNLVKIFQYDGGNNSDNGQSQVSTSASLFSRRTVTAAAAAVAVCTSKSSCTVRQKAEAFDSSSAPLTPSPGESPDRMAARKTSIPGNKPPVPTRSGRLTSRPGSSEGNSSQSISSSSSTVDMAIHRPIQSALSSASSQPRKSPSASSTVFSKPSSTSTSVAERAKLFSGGDSRAASSDFKKVQQPLGMKDASDSGSKPKPGFIRNNLKGTEDKQLNQLPRHAPSKQGQPSSTPSQPRPEKPPLKTKPSLTKPGQGRQSKRSSLNKAPGKSPSSTQQLERKEATPDKEEHAKDKSSNAESCDVINEEKKEARIPTTESRSAVGPDDQKEQESILSQDLSGPQSLCDNPPDANASQPSDGERESCAVEKDGTILPGNSESLSVTQTSSEPYDSSSASTVSVDSSSMGNGEMMPVASPQHSPQKPLQQSQSSSLDYQSKSHTFVRRSNVRRHSAQAREESTDRQPAADDVKPAADDVKPAADDDDEKPTADDEKPAADDEKPAADDEMPAADDEMPAADDEMPAADDEMPAADGANTVADATKPVTVPINIPQRRPPSPPRGRSNVRMERESVSSRSRSPAPLSIRSSPAASREASPSRRCTSPPTKFASSLPSASTFAKSKAPKLINLLSSVSGEKASAVAPPPRPPPPKLLPVCPASPSVSQDSTSDQTSMDSPDESRVLCGAGSSEQSKSGSTDQAASSALGTMGDDYCGPGQDAEGDVDTQTHDKNGKLRQARCKRIRSFNSSDKDSPKPNRRHISKKSIMQTVTARIGNSSKTASDKHQSEDLRRTCTSTQAETTAKNALPTADSRVHRAPSSNGEGTKLLKMAFRKSATTTIPDAPASTWHAQLPDQDQDAKADVDGESPTATESSEISFGKFNTLPRATLRTLVSNDRRRKLTATRHTKGRGKGADLVDVVTRRGVEMPTPPPPAPVQQVEADAEADAPVVDDATAAFKDEEDLYVTLETCRKRMASCSDYLGTRSSRPSVSSAAGDPSTQQISDVTEALSDSDVDETEFDMLPDSKIADLSPPVPQASGVVSMMEMRALWRDLPQVQEGGYLEKLSSSEVKLQEAIYELQTSEESYNKSLKVLVDFFMVKFRGCDDETPLCCKEDIDTLFSNSSDLLEISSTFLADLRQRSEESIVVESVSDLIMQHIRLFEPYVGYCREQCLQNAKLNHLLQTDPTFEKALRQLEQAPDAHKLPISSYLLLPMQRITRMPLLLRAVVERTPDESDEKANILRAMEYTQKLVKRCNEGARSLELMSELESQLKFEKVTQMDIIAGHRIIYQVGVVRRINQKKRKKLVNLYAFNDLVLVTKTKSEKKGLDDLQVIDYCKMPLVIVHGQYKGGNESNDLRFSLVFLENHQRKERSYFFEASSGKDMEKWMSSLNPPMCLKEEGDTIYNRWNCPVGRALYAFQGDKEDDLNMVEGQEIEVLRRTEDGWCFGLVMNSSPPVEGWFPMSYIADIPSEYRRALNVRQRYHLLKAAVS